MKRAENVVRNRKNELQCYVGVWMWAGTLNSVYRRWEPEQGLCLWGNSIRTSCSVLYVLTVNAAMSKQWPHMPAGPSMAQHEWFNRAEQVGRPSLYMHRACSVSLCYSTRSGGGCFLYSQIFLKWAKLASSSSKSREGEVLYVPGGPHWAVMLGCRVVSQHALARECDTDALQQRQKGLNI